MFSSSLHLLQLKEGYIAQKIKTKPRHFGHLLLQIYLKTKFQLAGLCHQMFFIQYHILFCRAMTQTVSKQALNLEA
jgi:hypothetical protein